jgi:hypothetical protein
MNILSLKENFKLLVLSNYMTLKAIIPFRKEPTPVDFFGRYFRMFSPLHWMSTLRTFFSYSFNYCFHILTLDCLIATAPLPHKLIWIERSRDTHLELLPLMGLGVPAVRSLIKVPPLSRTPQHLSVYKQKHFRRRSILSDTTPLGRVLTGCIRRLDFSNTSSIANGIMLSST